MCIYTHTFPYTYNMPLADMEHSLLKNTSPPPSQSSSSHKHLHSHKRNCSHEMATNLSPCFCGDKEEEEDYIVMDLSFSSTNFIYRAPQSKDFEFQMSSIPNDKGTTTSSADELFYKGQLLPLHSPPRLQMVQKLLEASSSSSSTTTTTNTSSSSPVESCGERNPPDEDFIEWSSELSSFADIKKHPRISWSEKMKLIKQSIILHKLGASSVYVKSLFGKTACNVEDQNPTKVEESSNDTKNKEKDHKIVNHNNNNNKNIAHRRSFSGAIKRHSTATKRSSFSSSSVASSSFSSSSSSFNSSGFQELHFLKRSYSSNKIEHSIEAAIAHCKKSQQIS